MTTSAPRQDDTLATAKRAEGQMVAQKDGLLRIVQGLRRVDTGTYALRIRLAENLGIGTIDINAMAFVGEVDGLTPKDLGKALNITTGSVTAMVDRLESKGFMVRKPNPTDRRSVLLHLSPEGTDAMQWANDHFAAAAEALLQESSEGSIVNIAEFLEGIGQRLMAAASAPEETDS
ncbi:MarR family winged helix-turn-helix transcriptional regulator [Arthrobacter humicola]|jgi:DNA-binding MarR family transcriptional regulator|uniref:MarR family winged helix-turn-helix transcriptional regulator n=1 Tax=Arthrobacter humicola TaxID=409291 RepID=UPI001FABB7FA|nr:MarR family transcriptional regulator [Arthrobacter humicola]MCI9872654.1 MarR family transcriptional regulator [Arthrobacter humicola]